MSQASAFRRLLAQPEIVVAPGAYDALTARLVEKSGFPAVYLTGAGVSYSALGQPDLGLVSLTEMVERAAQVVRAAGIPVIADADTGYGGPLNVIRTVREYERAGVAAIQLEDQSFPKRCGHLARKSLISPEEMCAKIEAACWARVNPETLIIGRTDARDAERLPAALERARRYAAAGAELIFVEAPESVEELGQIGREFPGVAMANMVEGGKTPLLPAGELQEMGFKLVIFPNLMTRVMVRAGLDALATLKRSGSSMELLPRMLSFSELNRFLGLEEMLDLADRFPTKEESP